MTASAYASPIVITPDGRSVRLQRISMGSSSGSDRFDENWLQETLFRNPTLLPIDEIDPAYESCIPVCRELSTPAGPLDLLYVTPKGRLVIVETKLWRNPEARRAVVTQALDYAKELAEWEYEDLAAAVARANKGNADALFNAAKAAAPDLAMQAFIDHVTVTLRTGRFLILIVGDGIREGVHALTDFLDRFGSLEFTFGLVEVGVYQHPEIGRVVQPRILAKSLIVKRSIVTFAQPGAQLVEEGVEDNEKATPDPAWQARAQWYFDFWTKFLATLRLDDASQPMARPNKSENIYFPQPPSGSQAWISAYFAQSKKQVGVYFRFLRDAYGDTAYKILIEDREAIEAEMQMKIDWWGPTGKPGLATAITYDSLESEETRAQISQFFATTINRFVNVLRPRLTRIARDLDSRP